jgi:hypothetical protein
LVGFSPHALIFFLITLTLTFTFTLILLHSRWCLWFTPLPCYISKSHHSNCIIRRLICLHNKTLLLAVSLFLNLLKTDHTTCHSHCKRYVGHDRGPLVWCPSNWLCALLGVKVVRILLQYTTKSILWLGTTMGHLHLWSFWQSKAPQDGPLIVWKHQTPLSAEHFPSLHLRCEQTHLCAGNTEKRMGKICAQDSLWISHYVKAGSMHISHTIRTCPGHPSEGWISTPTSSTRYLVSCAAFRRFYISPSKPGKEKCSHLRQGQPRWKACRQSYAVGSNWSSSPSSIPSTPGCHTCAHTPPFQHSIYHPSRPSNLDTNIENSTKRLRMLHDIPGHIHYNSLHIYQQPKAKWGCKHMMHTGERERGFRVFQCLYKGERLKRTQGEPWLAAEAAEWHSTLLPLAWHRSGWPGHHPPQHILRKFCCHY